MKKIKLKEEQDPKFIQKIDDYVLNPLRTGAVKSAIQITDMLASFSNTRQQVFDDMPVQTNDKEIIDTPVKPPEEIYDKYKKESTNAWKETELRKKGIEYIKKNREQRMRFLQSGSKVDTGIIITQNILEGMPNPVNWCNPYGFVAGLAFDLVQGGLDTTWEKTEIEGKKIEDFDEQDYKDYMYGALTTTAVHGVTKGITKGVKKVLEKNNVPKTPLDKIQEEVNKHGIGATEPRAMVELAERMETGETISLERGKNFSKEVDEFFTNTTEKRLSKIFNQKEDLDYSTRDKGKNYSQQQADFENKLYKEKKTVETKGRNINISKSVSRTLKPVKAKIQLAEKQIQAEYLSDLAFTHMENGGTGNFHRLGDLNELIADEMKIDGKVFKKMIRGDFDVPEKLVPYAEKWRNVSDEYVRLKHQGNLSNKGYNFDIVYDKQLAMRRISQGMDSEKLEIPRNFKEGFLKREHNRVFLSAEEASKLKIGATEGIYEVSDYNLVAKLKDDINATTHDVETLGNGRVMDYKSKDWVQVATENAPLPEMEEYFTKKNLELLGSVSENDVFFLRETEKKALDWLDGVLDEINAEADPVNAMNYIYKNVIDEKSGFNVLKDKLSLQFDSIKASSNDVDVTTKHNVFSHRKVAKQVLEDELHDLHSISSNVRTRKYSDMSFTGKTVYNVRNAMMYKYLANLNYLKETFSNKSRINSGAIDLGFRERINSLQSAKEMIRATKTTAKYFKNIKEVELSKIVDPMERLQAEAFLDRVLETEVDMRGHRVAKAFKKAGELGASGQSASDLQRIALSEWFTANAMMKELSKMEFETTTPTMRQILLDAGIDNAEKFNRLKQDVLSHGSLLNFLDTVKDRGNNSQVKEIFSQFSDVMGKELNAFDSDSMQVIGRGTVSSLWVKANSMFRMYSMNILGRVLDKATTYIDDDGFTRMRFIQDGHLALNRNSFTGLGDWKRNVWSRGINSGSTAMEVAAMVYGIHWITGKATGTTADEMTEAKMEALMHGEYGDTVIDVVKTGLIDNIGLDITMGGQNVVASYFDQSVKGIIRDMSSERLSIGEKILWGAGYLASPNVIARGIDNIKFEKNIPSRITTTSPYTKDLWKYKYKYMAQEEQDRGVLPFEKIFSIPTNWAEYFKKHSDQAERFGEFEENTPQEAKVAFASGIMEMAEYGMRNEKLEEILVASDSIEEREMELEKYGMDFGSQLNKLDDNNLKVMHAVLSYSQIYTPETVLLILNEYNSLTTEDEKAIFLENFIPDGEEKEFDKYLNKVFDKGNDKKLNEIYDREYSTGTEGYIEFLETLRSEI